MKKFTGYFFEFLIYAAAVCYILLLCRICPFDGAVRGFGKNETIVVVPNGVSASFLAAELKEKNIILSSCSFKFFLRITGMDKSFPAGGFRLKAGSSYSVIRQLKSGKSEIYSVTIIPGRTMKEISVSNSMNADKIYSALANDTNFPEKMRPFLPERAESRIIFLLPDTYFLSLNDNTEEQLVRVASRLWMERVGKNIPAESYNAKMILDKGILASIVEGEAKVEEDRAVLAGIFCRRLKIPMRLQSCATVVYCWKEKGVKKKSLSYNDLMIDSPYNTYRNDGLPPGPINVPSEASWMSALNPAETDYLYFFAVSSGKHVFSKTYSEHLSKQREALR